MRHRIVIALIHDFFFTNFIFVKKKTLSCIVNIISMIIINSLRSRIVVAMFNLCWWWIFLKKLDEKMSNFSIEQIIIGFRINITIVEWRQNQNKRVFNAIRGLYFRIFVFQLFFFILWLFVIAYVSSNQCTIK